MFKASSNLLTDHSKAVLLLWILFVIYILRLSILFCLACSLQPCGHLLEKGLPLGSLVWDILVSFCHSPIWCLESGVSLDLSIPDLCLPYTFIN